MELLFRSDTRRVRLCGRVAPGPVRDLLLPQPRHAAARAGHLEYPAADRGVPPTPPFVPVPGVLCPGLSLHALQEPLLSARTPAWRRRLAKNREFHIAGVTPESWRICTIPQERP